MTNEQRRKKGGVWNDHRRRLPPPENGGITSVMSVIIGSIAIMYVMASLS